MSYPIQLIGKNAWWKVVQLLVFSVMPYKIDRNKNQNHSIDKLVQNLRKELR